MVAISIFSKVQAEFPNRRSIEGDIAGSRWKFRSAVRLTKAMHLSETKWFFVVTQTTFDNRGAL